MDVSQRTESYAVYLQDIRSGYEAIIKNATGLWINKLSEKEKKRRDVNNAKICARRYVFVESTKQLAPPATYHHCSRVDYLSASYPGTYQYP